MRLEEYSELLKLDSSTIEFFTEHGKTIPCQKQVGNMKKELKEAQDLLQAMIEAKDVPTIEVIHRLCGLAKVLDHLKLQKECLVVGDYAIKLARAFSSRAAEFHNEEVQIIFLIAHLNVYKSRACSLFIQAISICDAFVMMDGSDSAKVTLLDALVSAGTHDGPPALCAQWLGRAVDLISELPSAMVTDEFRCCVYINYGVALGDVKENSTTLAAKKQAVAFCRSLGAGHGQVTYKIDLAIALHNYGITLHDMGHFGDALSVKQEAVSLYRALAVDGHEEHKQDLADALDNYGDTLHDMGNLEDALGVRQEAASLHRALAVDGHQEHKMDLVDALDKYGNTLHDMGHLEDALSVTQEAVSLYCALPVDGQKENKKELASALNNYGAILHDMGHFEDALSVTQQAVSLYRALAVGEHEEYKRKLARALRGYGAALRDMGLP